MQCLKSLSVYSYLPYRWLAAAAAAAAASWLLAEPGPLPVLPISCLGPAVTMAGNECT